jgi:hypothetical protein
MAGHCHVMALALKRIHPDWQLRAHIGWDEDAEDDDDYRVDHIYVVAPDGTAYDCRGRFDSEQQLVGPNEVGVEDTQFVDMDWAEIKRLIQRGELKPFDMQDVERATSVAKQMQLREETVAPVTVYHGNQGGIHRELITPMWWTEDRDTAEYYATQGGADGYVYSATLTCKNPYVIVKGKDEPNDMLQKYASLIEQGYDSIHDPRLGDWIPFHARDIHVTGREDVDGDEQELNELGNTRPEYTRPDRQRSGKHRFTTQFTGAQGKQRQVDVYFFYNHNTLEIDFKVDGRINSYITGRGDAAPILSAVRHIVEQELPKILKRIPRLKQVRFRSYVEASSRVSLYRNRAVPIVSRILGPDWRYYGEFDTMGSQWFYWQHRTVTGNDRVRMQGYEPQEQPDEPYDVGETERFRLAWEKRNKQSNETNYTSDPANNGKVS